MSQRGVNKKWQQLLRISYSATWCPAGHKLHDIAPKGLGAFFIDWILMTLTSLDDYMYHAITAFRHVVATLPLMYFNFCLSVEAVTGSGVCCGIFIYLALHADGHCGDGTLHLIKVLCNLETCATFFVCDTKPYFSIHNSHSRWMIHNCYVIKHWQIQVFRLLEEKSL